MQLQRGNAMEFKSILSLGGFPLSLKTKNLDKAVIVLFSN